MDNSQHQKSPSRLALHLAELPSPEHVFKTRSIGWQELILLVLGPGVIILGYSINANLWLLAPLALSRNSASGLGWIVLFSAILQIFYNVELARYTLATGETPLLGLARLWPGRWLWPLLALAALAAAFFLGDWSAAIGASLFALISGRAPAPTDAYTIRLISLGLLIGIPVLLSFGRKLERIMEAVQAIFIPYILVGMFFMCLTVVPPAYWLEIFSGFLLPARPPTGSDLTLLLDLASFAALASGLNFAFIIYYREKGFGMASHTSGATGFLTGLFSRRVPRPHSQGVTFSENAVNAQRWNQWFRYLLIDQWGIYFVGILPAIIFPTLLLTYLARTNPTLPPGQENILVYAALRLGEQFGPLLSGWTLLTGFAILYGTQIVIIDVVARNFTDAFFNLSRAIRQGCKDDPRRLYYPFLFILTALIAGMILGGFSEQTAPSGALYYAAMLYRNIPAAALAKLVISAVAAILPLLMIYLNRQLPRPARSSWWSILILAANSIFFVITFINLLTLQLTGSPLLKF